MCTIVSFRRIHSRARASDFASLTGPVLRRFCAITATYEIPRLPTAHEIRIFGSLLEVLAFRFILVGRIDDGDDTQQGVPRPPQI